MRESTEEAVRHRLTRLERAVRRWQRIGMSVCVVVSVVILIGAATRKDLTTAEEVLARHFILVGRTPTARATLTVGKDGGPSLLLFDEHGKVRAGLTLLDDGRPSLGLRDAQEQSRVILTMEPDGTPVLRLLDAQGQVVWSAP
jgi:hypothetical protein